MNFQAHNTTDYVSKIRLERRKAQKPKIEKLRRDRINGSLDEIKQLVLEALNKDSSRYSKMEKADILEMTVQFLKGVQARQRLVESGIRSQAEHTTEVITQTSASQIPCIAQNQLQLGMNGDHKPVSVLPPSISPFVTTNMVAMATRPTFVWLPYPSPPPSPTEEANQTSDLLSQQTISTLRNGNPPTFDAGQIIPVTSPSNVIPPVWRPW